MRKLLNNKGLTLVEIIITLAILGIVISPLMAMFITSQKINKESEEEYYSIQLAQKYMEEIKGKDTLDSSYTDDDGDDIFERSVENVYGKYDLDITISPTAGIGGTPVDEYEAVIFQDTVTVIADTVISVTNNTYENIKIVLNADNLKITVANELGKLIKIYIYSAEGKDYDSVVNVAKGMVNVIKNQAIEAKPANLLYNISIAVTKDGEEINTIRGTTVLKYKPK